ncbi:MAG TPA: hypothetical protein VLL51_01380 [Gemmatimonadales bacterium]|nr:hypothetical protein [Gemmatimonadales bacterium]
MNRGLGVLALTLLLAACPSYDRYDTVVDEKGLVPADQFAAYGTEQAEAIAIGRALGSAHTGTTPEALLKQVMAGAEYARSLPGVATVVPDSTAFLLTVTFKSGWKKAIVPIMDGVPADQTPGLPPRN